jgi:TolB-like protein
LVGQVVLTPESKVAVLPLASPNGGTTSLGLILAEKVARRLLELQICRVLDRTNLLAVMAEPDLAYADLADQKNAACTAKLLSAEYLLTGTIVDAGDRVEATFKLLRGESGAGIAMTAIHISKNDDIRSLLVSVPRVRQDGPKQAPSRLGLDPGKDEVIQQDGYVVATVWAIADHEMERLQKARQRARALFADYMIAHMASSAGRDQLLQLARDTEQLLDAEEDGQTIRYKVRFPIPTK